MDPVLDESLRLLVAMLVGGAIGLNRDLHGKPTGVRTMGLVGLGAALIMVVAMRIGGGAAATRAIQGVVTGVGFLGAGVIVKGSANGRVHNLTTAASTWMTAALGIAIGVGFWQVALVATGLTLVLLVTGGPVEKAIRHRWPHRHDPTDLPPRPPGL